MRGSLLLNFDELINDLSFDLVVLYVNDSVRTIRYTDIIGLYSTNLNLGDLVRVQVSTSPSNLGKQISIIRRDYTTDDQGGDNGIRDTFITSLSGTTQNLTLTFTATTVSDAYNFQYIATCSTFTPGPTPTPTPTGTPTPTPTGTPTPTPTGTPTPTPTGTPTPTPTSTPTPTPLIGSSNILLNLYNTRLGTTPCYELKLSTNSGTTFNTITSPEFQGNFIDGDLNQDASLIYTFSTNNVYRSTNLGSSWSRITPNLPIVNFTKGSCSQDGQILSICGGYQNDNNGAYISYNSGNTFNLLSGSNITNRNIGRNYVTSNGFPMLFVYNNFNQGVNDYLKICSTSGSSVQNITGSGLGYWYDAVMSDDTKYILAAKSTNSGSDYVWNQSVYLSSNSGATFTAIPSMTGLSITSCNMSDDGQYMMVTSSTAYGAPTGNIWVSNNYGVSWTLVESVSTLPDQNQIFNGGDVSGDGKIMASFSDDYKLWLSQNYGSSSFTEITQTCVPRWVVIGR